MSDSLVSMAISQISRENFEVWAQKVLTSVEGYDFEPTGGLHDGGQDGYIKSISGDPDHYVQISKEQNTSSKIRKTIRSIRERREIKKLTYITSQTEAERDLIQGRIRRDLDVRVEIHDQRWLLVQVSLERKLEEALYGYVPDLLQGIRTAKNSKRQLRQSDRLSILTYLEAQARSLPESENFQSLCLDTVIYECLVGTDPTQEIFKSDEEIEKEISKKHPGVIAKSPISVSERLEFLSSKSNDPRIRRHSGGRYALPYEVRNQFDDSNVAIGHKEELFMGRIYDRVSEENFHDDDKSTVALAVHHAVVETFRIQAVNFINSFSSTEEAGRIEVYSIIRDFLDEQGVDGDRLDELQSVTSAVFRRICYSSVEEEREYLELLMKYYSVKFVMEGDVVVTQYFTEMARSLRIYVGSDIIVRCLSETFVRRESRGMSNALKKLQAAGVTLRITRQTVNEVFSHIHGTYLTFRNDYEAWYRNGNLEIMQNADRILIRSFAYAYFEPENHTRKPRDWTDFLNQFGRAAWFTHPDRNENDFGSFLMDNFDFDFVEIEDLLEKIDTRMASRVAKELLEIREKEKSEGNRKLARNDAEMALFINAERKENQERVTSNVYGYHTWWMTEETRILKALKKFGQHDDIIMLPQFLLNHYLLDPRRNRTTDGDNILTPTMFGLRITDRMGKNEMKNFLDTLNQYSELEEGAARARIRGAANELKRSRH